LYYDYANRLTKISSSSNSGIAVAEYRYDAFGRRVEKKLYDYTWNGSSNVAENSYVRFYYDSGATGGLSASAVGQQVIEERDGSGNTLRHAVWGNYIDELLLLDVNKDADTDPTEGTDARYYALSNTQVGHHTNSVSPFEDWAADPRNIQFVRGQEANRQEHVNQQGRPGAFQNPTMGPLIDRQAMDPTPVSKGVKKNGDPFDA
jgi:YD repeat-containing protein